MPNNVNSVQTLLDVLNSGLVVSGNADITVQRQTISGDALSNQRVSGYTTVIYLRNGRTDGIGITGGTFTEMADYVDSEVLITLRQSQVSGIGLNSGAVAILKTRVDDLKITVASGTFTNPPRPIQISENWPQPHQQVAKATLIWRFKYLQ